MRKVLGLSLTATTAAWALVDLADGAIGADGRAMADSADDLAATAAHSVETLARSTEIDAVRIAWGEGAAGSALKLTAKLRLLGFDDIDVLAEDVARIGRTRTARHIDPRLEIAYGAARTVTADDHDGMFRRLVAWPPIRTRLPIPRPPQLPPGSTTKAVAASVMVVAAGVSVAVYALAGGTTPAPVDPVTEPVASTLPLAGAQVISVPAAAPLPPPAPEETVAPAAVPELAPVEAAPSEADEPDVATAVDVDTVVEVATPPQTAAVPVPTATIADQPHLTAQALSAGLLPGPIPPADVIVPIPAAAPPAPPGPFDILDVLP